MYNPARARTDDKGYVMDNRNAHEMMRSAVAPWSKVKQKYFHAPKMVQLGTFRINEMINSDRGNFNLMGYMLSEEGFPPVASFKISRKGARGALVAEVAGDIAEGKKRFYGIYRGDMRSWNEE